VGTVVARIFEADPRDADFATALGVLDGMDYTDRTLKRDIGGHLYSIARPDAVGLGLWTLRRGVDIHSKGEIKPWNLASDIAEGSYYRFFPDGTTVMIATGHGPRTLQLSSYLEKMTKLDVMFNPILRTDKATYVASLDDVKRIEMTFTNEAVTEFGRVNETLGQATASLAQASGSDKLRITFDGQDSESRDSMWARSAHWVRDLVARTPIHGVSRLHVVVPGEFSGEQDIDVLKDKITYQMEVESGTLDLDVAMDVTAAAYSRHRDDRP
jgi:hypothetical protein